MFAALKYKTSVQAFGYYCQNPWNLKYLYDNYSIQHNSAKTVVFF